jgi:azurin
MFMGQCGSEAMGQCKKSQCRIAPLPHCRNNKPGLLAGRAEPVFSYRQRLARKDRWMKRHVLYFLAVVVCLAWPRAAVAQKGAVLGVLLLLPGPQVPAPQGDAPRILLDQPLRAVEYQLDRLSNDQLTKIERKTDDAKYRPVYYALLTRKGLAKEFRDEALAALVKMDQSNPTRVLLDALAKIPADDAQTADRLVGLLLAQPPATLRQQRDTYAQAIDAPSAPPVVRAAYGGMMIGDGKPDAAWQAAVKHDGHLVQLLRSVPLLPAEDLRVQLFQPIAALLSDSADAGIRAEAIGALAWTRRDTATFRLLAQEVLKPADAEAQATAIRSLQLMPESVWPKTEVEPLARAIVALVKDTPADRRTEPSTIDALQLGDKLAAALSDDARLAVRRDLRALGVQVVPIETVPEQMRYDVRWFPVEAGKPVQIVLRNIDAMPHNLLVGQPKSVVEIGNAAVSMSLPSDPEAKAYVPDSPLVLHATRLLNEGATERLNFTAPKAPGEYVFLCTFPGHWVRMYGVMLVVENLEAWEAHPTVPVDPVTNQPFASRR